MYIQKASISQFKKHRAHYVRRLPKPMVAGGLQPDIRAMHTQNRIYTRFRLFGSCSCSCISTFLTVHLPLLCNIYIHFFFFPRLETLILNYTKYTLYLFVVVSRSLPLSQLNTCTSTTAGAAAVATSQHHYRCRCCCQRMDFDCSTGVGERMKMKTEKKKRDEAPEQEEVISKYFIIATFSRSHAALIVTYSVQPF